MFSIDAGINPFLFGHGVPSKRVFTYAGSFGPTTIELLEEKHCASLVRSGLDAMTDISVRDRNSQDIVFELCGKRCPIVCDPVLLYGFGMERKHATAKLRRKYLLIYSYDNNMNDVAEVSEIREIAKRNGWLVVSAGFYHSWCDENLSVSPLELVGYCWRSRCLSVKRPNCMALTERSE